MNLPPSLQAQIDELCVKEPSAKGVVDLLIAHFTEEKPATELERPPPNSLVLKNLSLLLPERRRVELAIHSKGFAIQAGDKIFVNGRWSMYNLALVLDVPERVKPTYNCVITHVGGHGPWVVFSVPLQSADKFCSKFLPSEPINRALETALRPHVRRLASSQLAVVAHVGSREGILYMMDEFIFFGFKKPLKLAAVAEITAVSYTVITRLTFNVVFRLSDDEEVEFSMIPHEYYDNISAWVNEHGLSDESLAEKRRAKKQKHAEESGVLAAAIHEINEDFSHNKDGDSDEVEENGPDFEDNSDDSEDGEGSLEGSE